MSHYFTNKPEVKSNEKEFQVEILNKKYRFFTDHGVFSKGELDFASHLLITTWHKLNAVGSLLDVGCGYGALGIVLADLNRQLTVDMVDINERATTLAKKNVSLNKLDNVVVYESNLYEAVEKKFNHIISNPPIRAGKQVVHKILADAHNYLLPGGTLTVVMGKQHGAESAKKKLFEVFGNVELLERKKGFWILHSVKEDV